MTATVHVPIFIPFSEPNPGVVDIHLQSSEKKIDLHKFLFIVVEENAKNARVKINLLSLYMKIRLVFSGV